MTCWRIRHVSIFCFHSFCFTLTKLKIKYLEPHTFTLTPPSHNLILTYRLLGLQQISRLCFAVLFSTVYSQTAGCYHVAVFADLSWYMWDWCCVLVALSLCRQGPWEFNQSDDYRDARQRSPPTRQQRPKLTSSEKWSLSVRGSLLAERVWFFTEAAVWLLFILWFFITVFLFFTDFVSSCGFW